MRSRPIKRRYKDPNKKTRAKVKEEYTKVRAMFVKPKEEGEVEMFECSVCHSKLPAGYGCTHNGEKVCIKCLRLVGYYQCGHCHRAKRLADFVRLEDKDVCLVCEAKHYIPCAHCGKRHDRSDVKFVGGRNYCSECYDKLFDVCEECGAITSKGRLQTVAGETKKFCPNCINNLFATCKICRTLHRQSAMTRTDRGWYCSACNPRHEIREPSYKPTPVFFATEDEKKRENYYPMYYGIELEVECQDPIKSIKAMDMTDEMYVKRDGSLSDRGVEFVSMPCTLDYHKNNINWPERCANLVKVGTKSHNTDNCGLHIHMSRDRMSEFECVKLTWFINRHLADISVLARRTSPYHSQALSPEDRIHRLKKKDFRNEGRYDILNWQPQHTVEFRLPKGTLNAYTLMATIELCDAAVEYTRGLSVTQVSEGSFNDFLLWCQTGQRNRRRYSNLIAYYTKKNKCPMISALKKSALALENFKKVKPAAPAPVFVDQTEPEDPRYCRL